MRSRCEAKTKHLRGAKVCAFIKICIVFPSNLLNFLKKYKQMGTEKQIPKKRITSVQRKKQRLFAHLFNTDGSSRLPFGSYAKIAKKCQVSDTFVRQVLNVDKPEWRIDIYRAAISIIRAEAKEELALQQIISETTDIYNRAFEKGGSDE